ncbi:MAG: ABC transporter substrate-binding protein [Mycobacteriales bacterium]
MPVLAQFARHQRAVVIVNAAVLAAAVLSVGQVRYAQRDHDTAGPGRVGFDVEPGSSARPGAPTPSTSPSPGTTTATPGPGTSTRPHTPTTVPSSLPTASHGRPPAPPVSKVPDYGLRTQGVTATSVTIGADYDKTGCGGSGSLTAQFSSAVTGDQQKSFDTFVRYINDTGGIRGRTLKLVTVDDGGLYCPERHQSAAIQLADQYKVFLDIACLHEVSDLLAPKHLPFYGGRATKAEQRKQGMGQFQLYQDADGDFLNWAAFGKNYLHSDKHAPCFIHPDTDDFNHLEGLVVKALKGQGLAFKDIVRYADDPSTAQQQATTYAIEMKQKGCQQVWLLANNFIADVFFTNAARQQNWYPTWTWTARTGGIDFKLAGSLMNQDEWKNAVGLTTRIAPGESPYENNCARIYNRYHSGDGQDTSAAVQVACNSILTVSEAMRRAIDRTGVLTGNSLMVGVDTIRGDFSWDAFVPLTYTILDASRRDFTGYDLQTVAKWDTNKGDYVFPEYPRYWKVLGPGGRGAIDIRPLLRAKYSAPKR